MTQQTRATLKGVFEQGDVPQGSDYEDLIDSFVSLADTTAQTVTSDLTITGALNVNGTTQSSFGELYTTATAAVSASTAYIDLLSAATAQAALLSDFELSAANGSLKYTGAATKVFKAQMWLDFEASASADVTLALAIDGSALTRTESTIFVSTVTENISMISLVKLNQNEDIRMLIKGHSATASGILKRKAVLTVFE